MIAPIEQYDFRLQVLIRDTIHQMIESGAMRWKRKQVLNSDEAAMDIISRLPIEFRDIDTNKFRNIADGLDKVPAVKGGMPSFTNREPSPPEERICTILERWSEGREHIHSEQYETDSPERAAWRRKIKSDNGFQCACCGEFRTGELLQVHHYHYRSLGEEHPADVCCVCSPDTGSPCHMLLDFAREIRNGKVEPERIKGLFDL